MEGKKSATNVLRDLTYKITYLLILQQVSSQTTALSRIKTVPRLVINRLNTRSLRKNTGH
jgi:hypothetical protein